MSGDCFINDSNLKNDYALIKKLEYQHLRLEEKVAKSKNEEKVFRAHPKRIMSDSESTVSNSSRGVGNNGSSGNSHGESRRLVYQERKQKAQNIRKRLHEKLSIIGRHSPHKAETSKIGDHFDVSKEIINDRFRTLPIHGDYDTSSGESVDFEDIYTNGKNDKTRTKSGNNSHARLNCKDLGRRPSSKVQTYYNKGLTLLDFEKKCEIVLEKIVQTITDIRTTLTKDIIPPDGPEDELRRAVRIKEFSNRFSRNYLYTLSRQVKELCVPQQLAELMIKQKLLASYQIILNGLQAYHSHLTTSGGDSSFNQLKILMNNIGELCDVHRGLIEIGDGDYVVEFVDSLKLNAELMTQHINELHHKPTASVTDSALKSEASNLSLGKYGMTSNRKLTGNIKNMKNGKKGAVADKRFSMYTVTASFRKDAPWKKTVENLAKKKFNVKSRYKTATYKHRPPIQKTSDMLSLPKLKTVNSKSGVLKSTRLHTPLNEDTIKTMVESVDNKKEDQDHQKESHKEEILIKLLQYTLKQHQDGPVPEDMQMAEILKLVQKEQNVDNIKTIINNVSSEKEGQSHEPQQNLTLQITSQCSLSDCVKSSREKDKRKEPKVTVTGEKNIRLICITDDNSVVEAPQLETEETTEKLCQTEAVEPTKIIIRASSETQTDINSSSSKIAKPTQKNKQNASVKISRIKKCCRPLQHLEKKQAVSAIQYKLDFYRYCKNNPMYKKSTTCQPWLLMNKISEDILNHCLLAVAREIEVNDIVDKVYQAELQL